MKFTSLLLFLGVNGICCKAQIQSADSLRHNVRKYLGRNFSEIRTFNYSWQVVDKHNIIKFNTTIPIIDSTHFSLYGIVKADFYTYSKNEECNNSDSFFCENSNNQYYKAEINGMYRTTLAKKPLILNGNISVDGFQNGVKQVMGTMAAIYVLKRNNHTGISAGFAMLYPFDKVPLLPVLTYWHQFSSHWSVDVSLPRQSYLRYTFKENMRLSLGTMLQNDHFYFDDKEAVRLFYMTSLNSELLYEYVAMKHFYFWGRFGVSTCLDAGIYGNKRKKIRSFDVGSERRNKPFMTLGCSYNLYK